jgi:hypothetical protein
MEGAPPKRRRAQRPLPPPVLPREALRIEEVLDAVNLVLHSPPWCRFLAINQKVKSHSREGKFLDDFVEFLFVIPWVEVEDAARVWRSDTLAEMTERLLVTDFRTVVEGYIDTLEVQMLTPMFKLVLVLRDMQVRSSDRMLFYPEYHTWDSGIR